MTTDEENKSSFLLIILENKKQITEKEKQLTEIEKQLTELKKKSKFIIKY